jgi:hypothetical protein
MKNGSTLMLRALIVLICLAVLFVSGLTIYAIAINESGLYTPILFGAYLTLIPFFFAVYQTFKLLGYIDKNKAFSQLSVKVLKRIKYSAAVISLMYAAFLPYVYIVAQKDDAPGVVLIGMFLVFAPFVVATAVAVFEKLLKSAIDIKSENDLTV